MYFIDLLIGYLINYQMHVVCQNENLQVVVEGLVPFV